VGLYPSPEFSFVVYVSPTGNYFKSATSGLNLHLETRRSRASRGGMGNVKCCGNYAAALRPLMDCKKHGFHDNVFLELDTFQKGGGSKCLDDAVVQEMSAANVFFVLPSGEIVTPSLDRGTILPGVTRDSVLQIADAYPELVGEAMKESTGGSAKEVKASSRDVTLKEIRNATEAFCTGTAAELVPIARLATSPDDEDVEFDVTFKYGTTLPGGPVTCKLLELLRQGMRGELDISKDWIRDPFGPVDEFRK